MHLDEEFKITDDDLTRSDKFSQRVVSFGPHQYIARAEDMSSGKKSPSIGKLENSLSHKSDSEEEEKE